MYNCKNLHTHKLRMSCARIQRTEHAVNARYKLLARHKRLAETRRQRSQSAETKIHAVGAMSKRLSRCQWYIYIKLCNLSKFPYDFTTVQDILQRRDNSVRTQPCMKGPKDKVNVHVFIDKNQTFKYSYYDILS